MGFLSISQAADKLGVRPRAISDAFYNRRLDLDHFPAVGGRRLIPVDRLEELREALGKPMAPVAV